MDMIPISQLPCFSRRMMLETFRDHTLVQEKVLFLSSHFYSRLRAGKGATAEARMKAGYKNVSTWLSRSSLFTRSIIFIPINKDVHWSLAVILNPGIAGLESSDEDAFSCIAVLDPLGSYHRKAAIIRNLRAFLQMQWASSEGSLGETEAESVSEYGIERVLTSNVETPLQQNSYDCGVYVLKFAEVMLKNCLELGLLAQNDGVIGKDVIDNHLGALITSSAFTAEDITATRKQIQQYIEVDAREYLLRKDKAASE
uniref:Ubiquitin-like protease family profile domain-containing protein n=1 Tax=Hyaloperonospora arabidopsidis (strain Emoy2) TaxID=559515 RepID=M4C2N6_HYAAE